jgi:DNA-binding Xre family transcriptional regulator
MNILGLNLAEKMKHAGLDFDMFLEIMGIDVNVMNSYISADSEIPKNLLEKICRVLNCDPEEIAYHPERVTKYFDVRNLSNLLEKASFDKDTLIEVSGVNRRQVNKYLSGEVTRVTKEIAHSLSEALDVEVEDLGVNESEVVKFIKNKEFPIWSSSTDGRSPNLATGVIIKAPKIEIIMRDMNMAVQNIEKELDKIKKLKETLWDHTS